MTTDTDTEVRLRAGLRTHARTMVVERPPLDTVLAPAREAARRPAGPVGAGRSAGRPLPALVAVAVVIVVAAVAVVARLQADRPAAVRSGGEPLPVVWPLAEDDLSPDVQATAEGVAEAYVHDELGIGSEWRRNPEPDDGADSPGSRTVRFELGQGDGEGGGEPNRSPLHVAVVQIDGRWYVAGSATGETPRITRARVDGGSVAVEAVEANDPDRPSVAPATAEVFGRDGESIATARVPIDGGLWRFTLPLDPDAGPDAEPAAVRVSVDERSSAGGAPRFASTIVLPASIADNPARPLFPAVMPASSYEDAWRYTLTHPDDPRRDWQWALTNAFATVGNGRPSTPTFDDVVTRPDGLEMSGRFANGGAGTFELARLRVDGPWFVIRMEDDAIDVRDVEVTPTEARVTMVVAEDYRLAVARSCGGSAGQPVEQAWGHAGVELLCVFPMEPPGASDRTARSIQTLETTDDRSLLRYYDAWAP